MPDTGSKATLLKDPSELRETILEENRRVHALENAEYLDRHPEQTNWYQNRRLQHTLKKFLRQIGKPEPHLLDVGCGTGYLLLPLLEQGCRLTGVDVSQELVEVLKRRLPTGAPCKLEVGDIESYLETDSTQYDGIVVSAVLHHLFDFETVVRKLCNKLKPGGVLLVFFEPLRQQIKSPLRFKLHRLLGQLDESCYEWAMRRLGISLMTHDYEVADYQRQFGGIDPHALSKMVQEEKMKPIEMETYCARRFGISAFIANHILNTQNTFNLIAKKVESTASPGH